MNQLNNEWTMNNFDNTYIWWKSNMIKNRNDYLRKIWKTKILIEIIRLLKY